MFCHRSAGSELGGVRQRADDATDGCVVGRTRADCSGALSQPAPNDTMKSSTERKTWIAWQRHVPIVPTRDLKTANPAAQENCVPPV